VGLLDVGLSSDEEEGGGMTFFLQNNYIPNKIKLFSFFLNIKNQPKINIKNLYIKVKGFTICVIPRCTSCES
jgi:hypothetical protein